MIMEYSSQAWTTASSWTEPPACATYLTPTVAATSTLSRNGKKASEASATSSSEAIHAATSEAASSGGTVLSSKTASNAARSEADMASKPPSTKRTRALTLSCLLRPAFKGRPTTVSWKRSRQTRTFRAASLTQSTRLCWPAPTPTICPLCANATEFDCVYLHTIDASTRSRLAASSSSSTKVLLVTTLPRSALVKPRSLRFCASPTPKTSRYSDASPGT
mmetsp:Transcript_11088/g.44924  ORF Transcript_11088/g.44924 Transcript_11088/m.44924 type:complete len:220 (+) Transcript_11088:220-879(+)